MGVVTVLGLDPGFASCGHAELTLDASLSPEVVRLGVIRTTKSRRKGRVLVSDDNTRRLRELSSLLGMMIGDSDIVCSEALSHPRVKRANGQWTIAVSTACQNASVWGLIVGHVQHHKRALLQVTPQELRKRIGLERKTGKDDIRGAMEQRFGEKHLTNLLQSVAQGQRQHAYDALAAAVACIESDEVRLAVGIRAAIEKEPT